MSELERSSGMNLQDVMDMVLRRRVFFVVPFVVVIVASIVVGLFLPRIYETSSLIQVQDRQIIDPLVRGIAVSPENVRMEVEALTKQVLSWPKLEQLVSELDLAGDDLSPLEREDFIRKLKERIRIKVKNDDMVEIVYQDRNPGDAQKVVNSLTETFIEENARIKKNQARNAIDFIEEQLAIYRDKLQNSEKDFSTNKIESDLRLALNRKTLLGDRLKSLQQIVPSQVTTEQNPVVSQLQQRLGQLETELARLMLDAKEKNPHVEELKFEISKIKERIGAELQKSNVKESISTVNPLYLQTDQELKQVEMDIKYLERRKNQVENSGDKEKKQVSEEALADLERSKRVDEDIYQMLLRQLESAYVSERLQDSDKGERFRVIEYARLPLRPVKPNMAQIVLMGIAGGLGAGFALVFLVETVKRAFHSADKAKDILHLTVLGSISKLVKLDERTAPSLGSRLKEAIIRYIQSKEALAKLQFVAPHIVRKRIDTPISEFVVAYHEPDCKVADEYRVLRTHLFHLRRDQQAELKLLAVTSTIHGEGKSLTSANIAVTIGDSGKKVVLVDADLRKGTLHELFALPPGPGLAEALTGEAMLDVALRQTEIHNLSILPGGKRSKKPSELLGLGSMRLLLDMLKERFDMVILDCPPVLNMPDASILSGYADGVVAIVQADRTPQKDVLAMLALLRQVKAPLLGFVMTDVRYHVPRYLYDYYYEAGEKA